MISVTETAQKIIDLLNEKGWTQGTLADLDGRMCLFGAFAHAERGWVDAFKWSRELVAPAATFADALLPVVQRRFPARTSVFQGGSVEQLVNFNNDSHTTKEDVIGVLRELVDA
jgi:hypothetical protein